MGTFLSLTSVIGKTQEEVSTSLAIYARSKGGNLQSASFLSNDGSGCFIKEANGNTTVLYPNNYLEWDASSQFLSKELNASVFSSHIHDGDLWMYTLFANGDIVDRFNPVPDYWEEVDDAEAENWKGDADVVAKYTASKKVDIERYLVRWDLEAEKTAKAYPEDEFAQEDWQLFDFMKQLHLPLPIDNEGKPQGQAYKLWTTDLPLIDFH